MELFSEICNVKIISGAGNTNLLCAKEDSNLDIYKIIVDVKTRRTRLEEINARRLENYLSKHRSRFCFVAASKTIRIVNCLLMLYYLCLFFGVVKLILFRMGII